ncbi:MAG: hypothetical protein IT451_06825 [Candidatus Brocadia sp.]|nr:hypothetical protein [Candidatus Brocadia sp.]
MKENLPIIHIIGLPGAGKTSLPKRLSKKLNLPIFGLIQQNLTKKKSIKRLWKN